MISGRKQLITDLKKQFDFPSEKKIWIHCASLGEFEQGRPLIEKIKSDFPAHKILLTFYSPSGYDVRKDYPQVDYVTYLPFDNGKNAVAFIEAVKPDLAIFVKYEFWLFHLAELKRRQIPLFLISARFHKKQLFFKWYGILFRRSLKWYTTLFVQNQESIELLNKFKITNAVLAYDTRFDTVAQQLNKTIELPVVKEFSDGFNVIVAGSTWPTDERQIARAFYRSLVHHQFKLIVAPHHVDVKHLQKTNKKFSKYSIRYSEAIHKKPEEMLNKRVLILDNMGMLASVYKFGDLCYIGGGFNQGIHNTLEAAVFGKPLIFGPKYKKFNEAVDLINVGAGFVITSSEDLIQRIDFLNDFEVVRVGAERDAQKYVLEHTGGTKVILDSIRKHLNGEP